MFKKIIFSFVLILSTGFLCLAAHGEELSGSIQIKGSDTMVNLGQTWAETFSKEHPAVSVAVTGGGSGTGFAALIGGTCDIAEASRNIEEKEKALLEQKGVEPVELTVALDGVAIVVNPENPVSRLTLDQLADIFTGKITNWKDVGGPNMPIVILSREVNSGTHIYIKEHVLSREKDFNEFSPSALLLPSSQAIADEVAQNVNAIGYYGIGYVTAQQKALAIAKDASSAYVEPTMATVKSGAYPISRPLLMYTCGEPKGIIKAFLDFVLSPEGQAIVAKLDFIPVK